MLFVEQQAENSHDLIHRHVHIFNKEIPGANSCSLTICISAVTNLIWSDSKGHLGDNFRFSAT